MSGARYMDDPARKEKGASPLMPDSALMQHPPQAPPPRPPKTWFGRRKIITGMAIAVLILAALGIELAIATHVLGPSEAGRPGQTTEPGVGAVISQNGMKAATITITNVSVSRKPAAEFEPAVPQNGWFVTAHAEVTAADVLVGDRFYIDTVHFYAEWGNKHFKEGGGNAAAAPGSLTPLIASLDAGQTATGTLVFDMPGPHGKIAYAPNADGRALAYWRY